MNTKKAIEILEDYHKSLPHGVNDDYLDAIKLGIEALKRLLAERPHSFGLRHPLLPGETDE